MNRRLHGLMLLCGLAAALGATLPVLTRGPFAVDLAMLRDFAPDRYAEAAPISLYLLPWALCLPALLACWRRVPQVEVLYMLVSSAGFLATGFVAVEAWAHLTDLGHGCVPATLAAQDGDGVQPGWGLGLLLAGYMPPGFLLLVRGLASVPPAQSPPDLTRS